MEVVKEYFFGGYSKVYTYFSWISLNYREFSRKIRGRKGNFIQKTRLPLITSLKCIKLGLVRIVESKKVNGNIQISEMGFLCQLAKNCSGNTAIFEIGTFDGRTTLNLALNAPLNCQIHTLDLPIHQEPVFKSEGSERIYVEKPTPGLRYKNCKLKYKIYTERITQLLADSASFDFSGYNKKCSLVFVDGSHAYENVIKDSYTAMNIIKTNGCVIWHDYGVWNGVTQALEDFEKKEKLGLRHIRGTSLVILQPK